MPSILSVLKKITKFQFEKVGLDTIMGVVVQFEDKKYRELLENKFSQPHNTHKFTCNCE